MEKTDWESVNYAELRRYAKEAGFKANQKAEILRQILREHYSAGISGGGTPVQPQQPAAVEIMEVESVGVEPEAAQTEAVTTLDAAAFVTKRRGRRASKRHNSGEGLTECNPNINLVSPRCPSDENVPDSGNRSAKRRRVSAAQDSQMSGLAENKIETNGETQELREKEKKVTKPGKIPRLVKTNKPALKPVTPNFKKLHEAHFNKMESIDSYVQRKKKQLEAHSTSVKELKSLSDKTIAAKTAGKPQAVLKGRATPVEKKPVPDKRRHTHLASNKPAVQDSVPFKPSVLSTRRINVRFSELPHSNDEQKSTLAKTPARKSFVCTPVRRATVGTPARKSTVGTPARKSTVVTPARKSTVGTVEAETKASVLPSMKTPGSTFVFSAGNTTLTGTPGTSKKAAFDLKASLSRPLNYQPHKGKLKPFAPSQENSVGKPQTPPSKSVSKPAQTLQSHQKNFKQHQVQTRDERRAKHQGDRKQKKENMLGARRGLVMA